MKIDSSERNFRLTPLGVEIFERYESDVIAARRAKWEAAQALLVELGVPDDVAESTEIGMRKGDGLLLWPSSLREHIPDLLTKPNRRGHCFFKDNRKKGREINARFHGMRIPSKTKYFPSLRLDMCWFIPGYMCSPRFGRYGDGVYLLGIPKTEEYDPDLELIEELTLAEWAAIVEDAEASKSTGEAE